jgi:hypothetical protein
MVEVGEGHEFDSSLDLLLPLLLLSYPVEEEAEKYKAD